MNKISVSSFSYWPVMGFFLLLIGHACSLAQNSDSDMSHSHTNALIHETSPYLLQHAHNPVDWYPWGDEALEKARQENKLIIISVGYAACHWCHVMEHESFEDSTVAELMNRYFVSIKVDREERPDIDQIYMSAVQLMTGQGGWPMNVVCLPDGRPIWGGTYFPKANWMSALSQLYQLYRDKPQEAIQYAERLTEGVQMSEDIVVVEDPAVFTTEHLVAVLEPWRKSFDMRYGGPNRAPKFPIPNNWEFLMQVAHFRDEPQIEEALELTLRKMAQGGIYDQIGGGFARYSVDSFWKVPHFEKMTYDNGQLVSLYAQAYRYDPKPLYRSVVYETLEYTKREMSSPEGGFYASLDADSEGEEGKFYIWTAAELNSVLGKDADWFREYYNVEPQGNWEHGNNILLVEETPEEYANRKGLDPDEFVRRLGTTKENLLMARAERIRPGLDDKILTSWNALMLKGYAEAYMTFGEMSFIETALNNAHFIEEKLRDGDRLNRNYKEGRSTINAFLDDYALLADAYLTLYRATFDPSWLERAEGLVEYCRAHFFSPEKRMFYYTSDLDPALIARKMEIHDNVIPASNSVMANVLFDLGYLRNRPDYLELAQNMLNNVRAEMPRYGSGYSNWGILLLKYLYPHYEIVVAGPEALSLGHQLRQEYLPNTLIVAATAEREEQLELLDDRFVEGETRIYVCQNKVCQLPVQTVDAALKQLKGN